MKSIGEWFLSCRESVLAQSLGVRYHSRVRFRKRVEMVCLLLAVAVAAISSSQRSPDGKPADATPLVLQHVLPSHPAQTLRVGDSREKALQLLGFQHYSQYVGCDILNADYWYLPGGGILSADTGDFSDTIRRLSVKPAGSAKWLRVEAWSLDVSAKARRAEPWLTTVRSVAPLLGEQHDLSGKLLQACRLVDPPWE